MIRKSRNTYTQGQKLKLMIDIGSKSVDYGGTLNRTKKICTVVKQYPHIVHMTYPTRSGEDVSISMTPWEIEHNLKEQKYRRIMKGAECQTSDQ